MVKARASYFVVFTYRLDSLSPWYACRASPLSTSFLLLAHSETSLFY